MSIDRSIVRGLLDAYRRGFFPMAEPGEGDQPGPIGWYSPDPRAVLPLDALHVPRSLRREVRRARFTVTADRAFEDVMRGCAGPRPGQDGTWIDERIIRAYTMLHRAGHAHSVEARRDGRLVGGLYGVSMGAAFFAESMFSLAALGGTNASKVCLVHLVHHLRRRGYTLLDVQFRNPHIDRFGVTDIPRSTYLRRLASALRREVEWAPFEPGLTVAEFAARPA